MGKQSRRANRRNRKSDASASNTVHNAGVYLQQTHEETQQLIGDIGEFVGLCAAIYITVSNQKEKYGADDEDIFYYGKLLKTLGEDYENIKQDFKQVCIDSEPLIKQCGDDDSNNEDTLTSTFLVSTRYDTILTTVGIIQSTIIPELCDYHSDWGLDNEGVNNDE